MDKFENVPVLDFAVFTFHGHNNFVAWKHEIKISTKISLS